MAELLLPDVVVRHLAYHTRMAALFATAANITESASEALLASTILDLHGAADAADSLTHDLPGQRVADADPVVLAAARRRAHDLALELLGHFVSEGQFDSAALYEALAAHLHHPRSSAGAGAEGA
jgi:hypothetical protein